jgi:hypothetical protein
MLGSLELISGDNANTIGHTSENANDLNDMIQAQLNE